MLIGLILVDIKKSGLCQFIQGDAIGLVVSVLDYGVIGLPVGFIPCPGLLCCVLDKNAKLEKKLTKYVLYMYILGGGGWVGVCTNLELY